MKQTYQHITIVAAGELEKELLSQIHACDFIIGVDFGAWWLLANNVVPDVAIGDFDSVTAFQWGEIEKKISIVKKYPAHKNYTDTELAVQYALKLHPKELTIFGGIGSRIDHTLGAIGLLDFIARNKVRGVMRGNKYQIELLSVGVHQVQRNKKLHYVSLIPVSATARVTLKGFTYDGAHLLKRNQTKGVSNELRRSTGTITIDSGTLLVIQTNETKI